MDQERDSRVRKEVEGLAGSGIGCHDDGRVRTEWGRGEVGVGHQGDVGSLAVAGSKMELGRSGGVSRSPSGRMGTENIRSGSS